MLDFLMVAAFIGLGMLVWDCIEVGRNDAANLVNAVFGARVLNRRTAVMIAGAAVILGASFSSPVIETARKGIFDPTILTIQMAMANLYQRLFCRYYTALRFFEFRHACKHDGMSGFRACRRRVISGWFQQYQLA